VLEVDTREATQLLGQSAVAVAADADEVAVVARRVAIWTRNRLDRIQARFLLLLKLPGSYAPS
jgi:hypothetical protein